jgi:homoserine dehydrogenase
MSAPLRVGIAGLGTVGAGALHIMREQAALLEARCGRAIEVVAVSARDANKQRNAALGGARWEANALSLATADDIDLVVEVIGGADGIAAQLVSTALENGKAVVTANKALIATHGMALVQLAEKKQTTLAFEAAVAGGIPILKVLREGLVANQFTKIIGILNGTSNYILTRMANTGCAFEEALVEAQALGYAEADPSFDVDGVDTAQKLAILTSFAFGCPPNLGAVYVEGIRGVTKCDMEFASELGHTIKLLGITELTDQGIMQRVHPCLLPANSPVGVDDVFNAIVVEGSSVGRVILEGRGAGSGPTASSIVADIVDIASSVRRPSFGLPPAHLRALPVASMDDLSTRYYIRIGVIDQPGVLASITAILGENQISVESFLQHARRPGEIVQIVLTTHQTQESALRRSLQAIAALDPVIQSPTFIRMELHA